MPISICSELSHFNIKLCFSFFFSEIKYIPAHIGEKEIRNVLAGPTSKAMAIQCEYVKCGRCSCDRPWMVDAETQCNLSDLLINDLRHSDYTTGIEPGEWSLCIFYCPKVLAWYTLHQKKVTFKKQFAKRPKSVPD